MVELYNGGGYAYRECELSLVHLAKLLVMIDR